LRCDQRSGGRRRAWELWCRWRARFFYGIFRNDFLKLATNGCRAIESHRDLKLTQMMDESVSGHGLPSDSLNLLAARWMHFFSGEEELFIEFLAVPQARELDADLVFSFAG
jgi:hypothetical protein